MPNILLGIEMGFVILGVFSINRDLNASINLANYNI